MPVSLMVHDERLEGRTPLRFGGLVTFEVSDDTRLSDFFDQCILIADDKRGISTLYLMAQGGEHTFAQATGGGYGLIFCHESIHLGNVNQFERLAGKVDEIILLVCSPSVTSSDIHQIGVTQPELAMTFHGDGNELCRQMAIHANAPVTAAREAQTYVTDEQCTTLAGYELFCEPGFIDFGDLEGTVIVYNAKGDLAAQWTNPSSWRDTHGDAYDPRLEIGR